MTHDFYFSRDLVFQEYLLIVTPPSSEHLPNTSTSASHLAGPHIPKDPGPLIGIFLRRHLQLYHMLLFVLYLHHRLRAAMEAEMASLIHNNTWVLVPFPPHRKPITCKWIIRRKYRPDGSCGSRFLSRAWNRLL